MTSQTQEGGRQAGRVTLVTGASRGIGNAVARAIAGEGGQVIALARTQGGLEDLDDAVRRSGGAGVTLVVADVTDAAGLERLAAAVTQRWGRLDGLVANAGVLGPMTPAGHIRAKEWDSVISVNLTANQRLIAVFDPLLRASPTGRAVFITSGVVTRPRAYFGAYAASKAGLEALVACYAAEMAELGVRVNLYNPGPTRTGLRSMAAPGEDPTRLPTPDDVARPILDLLDPASRRHGERLVFQPERASA